MRIIPFYTSESQLVRALQKGEARAQKIVYERYAARMLAVCCRYVANRADAEEVMIDGFVRVFDKINQFREEGSFEGWIRRIMVTESLMFLRKTKTWRHEVALEEVTVEPNSDWGDENLSADELMLLIAQLPDHYRTVFNLYAIEGYSHAEIADLLGISEGTSKSQLSRARAQLQRRVNQLEQQHLNNPLSYGQAAN